MVKKKTTANPKAKTNPKIDEKLKRKTILTKSRSESIVGHLSSPEDLFYFLSITNKKDIEKFLAHYADSDSFKSKDPKIDTILKKAKTSSDLMKELKGLLAGSLKDELGEIKEIISERRKNGDDPYIEDLKLVMIPSKIKMFESTSEKDDFYKVKKILHEVRELLKNPPEKKEEDLRTKIEKKKVAQTESKNPKK